MAPKKAPKADQPLSLAVKKIAQAANAWFCPRCAWVENKADLPSHFPGVFSRLDSISKAAVNLALAESAPFGWMKKIPAIQEEVKVGNWRNYRAVDTTTGLGAHGTPDAMFRLADGSYLIIDYKTAILTDAQDEMRSHYRAQLSLYAWIGEKLGYTPVSHLALVYFEPMKEDALSHALLRKKSVLFPFELHFIPVEYDPNLPQYFATLKEILAMPTPPPARQGCKDCEKREAFLQAMTCGAPVPPQLAG